ncbi:MAG: protein kinase [Alphaproteobacteria bacterium]|nr:protein kinase [Alphaproteobacteria bacterium]
MSGDTFDLHDPQDDAEEAPTPERYTLRERLGEGGVGEVWAAWDRQLDREVALKRLRADRRGDPVRFLREARLGAWLQHPNIVPVHDLGEGQGGAAWFTMKRVRGRSLAEVLAERAPALRAGHLDPAAETLRLVRALEKVCDAIAYAHSRGVLHLDLKPENVMIGEFGEVQVMDWGLARRVEEDPGPVAGTPAYMAPEQARGEPVGPTADVWSIGAMLYEVLALSPPLEGDDPMALLEEARRGAVEALVARRRRQGLKGPPPRELEAIVDRAMAPDPARRYPDVEALSEDLRRWSEGRPLAALRYSRAELLALWARRNRGAVNAALLTAVIAALLGAVGLVRYVRDVTAARDHADERAAAARRAERSARRRLEESRLATADALAEQGRLHEAEALYRSYVAGAPAVGLDPDPGRLGLWSVASRATPPLLRVEREPSVMGVAASPDGHTVLIGGLQALELRSLPTGAQTLSRPAEGDRVVGVAWASAGPTAWISNKDGTLWTVDVASGARALLANTGAQIHTARPLEDGSLVLVSGADSSLLLRAPDGRITAHPEWRGLDDLHPGGLALIGLPNRPYGVWDVRGGQQVLPLPDRQDELHGALSPDARTLAVYSQATRELRAVSIPDGAVRWRRPARNVRVVAWSPDGARVAIGGIGGDVEILDAATGAVGATLDVEGRPVSVQFTDDDEVLAFTTAAAMIGWRLFEGGLHRPIPVQGSTQSLEVSEDGRLLVLGGEAPEVPVIDLATRRTLLRLPVGSPVRDVRLGEDAVLLVTFDGRVQLWGLDGALRGEHAFDARALSADLAPGGAAVVGLVDGRVLRLDPVTGDVTPLGAHDDAVWGVEVLDAETAMTSGFRDGTLRLWPLDGGDGKVLAEPGTVIYHPGVSRPGGWVAVGNLSGVVRVYDLDTGALRHTLEGHQGPVLSVTSSPDGRRILTAGYDWTVRVWDAESGALLRVMTHHAGPIAAGGWTDTGFVTAADDGLAVVVDLTLPDRARPPDLEAGALGLARALSLRGAAQEALDLYTRARAAGQPFGELERARALWAAGHGEAAALAFEAAARAGEAPSGYLGLCARAARDSTQKSP